MLRTSATQTAIHGHLFREAQLRNGSGRQAFVRVTGGLNMEQDDDRERRIGAAILLGFAVFVLVAVASFYFTHPKPELAGIRSDIASITR
jgi:hypothetical protein